jgi:hypothetical protein
MLHTLSFTNNITAFLSLSIDSIRPYTRDDIRDEQLGRINRRHP